MSASINIHIHSCLPGDVNDWMQDHLQTFLLDNKEKYKLSDEDLQLIQNQDVASMDFVDLKREMLTAYGLKGGPVACVVKLIGKLKRVKGIVEPGKQAYIHY